MIKREKELEDVCQRVEKIIGRSEIQINDFKNFDFNAKGHNVKGNVKALGRATKLNITQLILSSDDSELEYVDEEPEENFKKKKTRSRSPCRWSSER